jgi:hypothetical protein
MPRRRPVTITIDGMTFKGTYYVQGSMVYTQYRAGAKRTGIGVSSAAQLLLSEMVGEELGLKAKAK